MKATLDLLNTMQRELENNRKANDSLREQLRVGQVSDQEWRLVEQARKREQDQWNRLRDIAKLIGWAIETFSTENDDDG
jgi:hypothetical protein